MEEIENKGKSSAVKNIGIAVIVIALVFLGYKYFGGDNGANLGTSETAVSIKDLMDRKEPLTCTFAINRDGATVNGGIIVYGKDVRGDFDITGTPVGNIASHFIVKDGVSYTWTSLANVGYKKAATESAGGSASAEDQASIVGVNDKVDYTCTAWNADLTRFNLPSGITFTELE